jgi:hypothetical protein
MPPKTVSRIPLGTQPLCYRSQIDSTQLVGLLPQKVTLSLSTNPISPLPGCGSLSLYGSRVSR